ncbi:BLUF domain-containing protein [Cognatilysobacter terrigena]|uniref:BLUF domain-containing protein n=1 Tax=Cognatilysobacter terrigena TaxID=2488749 RepID=UPI00105E1460|nr:BLUF domain-containing protein [Lysobacter terrigena]
MSDLIQIVYVSRSTFPVMPAERGIEPSVARILAQSRINNPRRGLVGALYFGDGCFFQCLEGRAADVDRLYAALLDDPRHTDLKVLSRRPIERTGFASWSMKYVPLDAPMRALLAERGLSTFDPYRFDEATVARVLALLRDGGDVMLPLEAAAPRQERLDADNGRALRMARLSIALASLALLASAAALVLAW